MKEIQLTNGGVTLVDDEDYDDVNRFKWHYIVGNSTKYAVTNFWSGGKNSLIYMHRWLTKAPKEAQVDHKNGKGLDNTRSNFSVGTASQNQHNRKSQNANITWDKSKQKYLVRITVDKQTHFIGRYKRLEDAQEAAAKARQLFAL